MDLVETLEKKDKKKEETPKKKAGVQKKLQNEDPPTEEPPEDPPAPEEDPVDDGKYRCEECGTELVKGMKFCSGCALELIWDDDGE